MTRFHPASGHFVWHNLMAVDPDAAAGFYGGLFGWTTRDRRDGGVFAPTLFRSGDHEVAGLVRADSGPSRWLPLLAVDHLETAVAQACRLGGRLVSAPPELPGSAAFATVIDPTGAPFCPAAVSTLARRLADASIPGRFCWNELLTTDPPRAEAFYGTLAGWTASPQDLGEQGRYWLFRRGDRDVAGMTPLPALAGMLSTWLPYVQVVSAEDTAALAGELGGAIVTPPGDVPDRGRSAVIEDPGGARLAVFALTVAA